MSNSCGQPPHRAEAGARRVPPVSSRLFMLRARSAMPGPVSTATTSRNSAPLDRIGQHQQSAAHGMPGQVGAQFRDDDRDVASPRHAQGHGRCARRAAKPPAGPGPHWVPSITGNPHGTCIGDSPPPRDAHFGAFALGADCDGRTRAPGAWLPVSPEPHARRRTSTRPSAPAAGSRCRAPGRSKCSRRPRPHPVMQQLRSAACPPPP
jgi:hypothetical protein